MSENRHSAETPPTPSLGELLRQLRRERGWTQGELGRRAGLTDVTVGHYEAGKTYPSIRRLSGLARALGVPVEELARQLPPPADSTRFGRVLRELRERRGLTQLQLADRIGCSASLISGYEILGTHPRPKTLGAIARALGVRRRELSGLVVKQGPPKQLTAFGRLLREARTARGLTQLQLALAVGLPMTTMASYERGNVHPARERIPGLVERIAKVLDLPQAQILKSLSRPRRPNVPTRLGHRLRQLRVDRGFDQRELAALSGLSQTSIAVYENGKAYPNARYLPALAKALEVEVDELAHLLQFREERKKPTPFGTELRRLRHQRGWTLRELAERSGVGAGSITSCEVGIVHPGPGALVALAQALGVAQKRFTQLLPPPPKTTPLGEELRRLRKQRGWTQRQLATRIGRDQEVVSGYELGLHVPRAKSLSLFARALGVPRVRLARLLPPPKTSPFGEEVWRLRKQRGLTHEELAARIGRGRNTIARYELGRTWPNTARLGVLARALRVSPEQLAPLMPSRPTPLGRELRRLRLQRGLSLRKLAGRIGDHPPTVSDYERGGRRLQRRHVAALAKALGISEQRIEQLDRQESG